MKKVKMNKKEIKYFNPDPLKWICSHVGQQIELPEVDQKSRYFIVRMDEGNMDWSCPDFIDELPRKELECLALCGGSWITASKLIKWISGGK